MGHDALMSLRPSAAAGPKGRHYARSARQVPSGSGRADLGVARAPGPSARRASTNYGPRTTGGVPHHLRMYVLISGCHLIRVLADKLSGLVQRTYAS